MIVFRAFFYAVLGVTVFGGIAYMAELGAPGLAVGVGLFLIFGGQVVYENRRDRDAERVRGELDRARRTGLD